MALRLSTGLRDGMLNATGMKEAFTDGVLYIFSGPQPSSADAAATGTVLAIITESGGAFTPGSPTNGLEFDAPVSGTVSKAAAETWVGDGVAADSAGWFRLMGNATDNLGSSTTLPRIDGSVGTSGADLNLGNISIEVGVPVTIDVFSFTLPAS